MKQPTSTNPQLLGDIRQLLIQPFHTVAPAKAGAQVSHWVSATVNSALTQLYWHIGQRIRNQVLNNQRAGYGEHIVPTLASQLQADYGRGFSAKSLRHMLRFAECYPDVQIVSTLSRQLSWTHIKTLIYIDDPLKRDFYLQMCQQERWCTRSLQTPHLRHSRELPVLGLNGDGNPFNEANYEATGGLHSRQQTQRHTVYRCHQQFDTANLATQKQPSTRLYSEIPSSPIGLFRAIPRHDDSHITGKTTQKMESCLENRTHRKNQSSVAGFVVRDYRITPKIVSFPRMRSFLQKPSFPRKPSSPRMRGSNITGQTGTHWIPAFAGMTEQIELLELDASGIHVAEYLTELPPKALLQQKLHEAITRSRQRLDNRSVDPNGEEA